MVSIAEFVGQAPSDDINFAKFLIDEGIDSISLTPDSVIKTIWSLNQLSTLDG